MSSKREVVVVSGARSPIGSYGGTLKDFAPCDLATVVVKEAIARAKVDATQIGHMFLGSVIHGEARDMYISRVAALNAGMSKESCAVTVNRLCGSGFQAIVGAAQSIMLGDTDIAIGAGAESMSRGGYLSPTARWGARMGDAKLIDMMVGALTDPFGTDHMGITAENIAEKWGIGRDKQDEFALQSQQRAVAAIAAGHFKSQIVPIEIKSRKGPVLFDTDEYPKADASMDGLAKLKPAFKKDGTVTPGNASGINDGAAAVMVMKASKAAGLGLKPMGRIASFATIGLDPAIMGMGPVGASTRALQRAGWKPQDLDLLEINEAFAAQACAVHQEMGWDTSKVNVNGGAIAIGHPIGASGCRILVTLLHEMQKRDAKKGIASLCIGGGMGVALTIER